jgi:hypothetical protein
MADGGTITLEFIARQLERVLAEQAAMRDELLWLSEDEVDDIPVMAHRRPPPPAPNAMRPNDPYRGIGMDQPQYNPDTGEVPSDSAEQRVAPEQAVPPEPLPDGAALIRPVRPDLKPVERLPVVDTSNTSVTG